MKIAVDAMGGDHAGGGGARGAVQAPREFHLPIVLVGREEMIREEVARGVAGVETLDVENASEVVEMQDAPGVAFRKKKDSSIRVGLNLVADGKASSFVSAGNSGAVMAGALMVLRKIRGVDRPAITATIPTPTGPIVLIDAGANVGGKPGPLLQFGCAGEGGARKILGIPRPRVGIGGIGGGGGKG